MAKIKQPDNQHIGGMRQEWDKNFSSKMSSRYEAAQKYIDVSCLRYCDKYMPFLTGKMKESGSLGTVIGSGHLIYTAPYARYQNYNNTGRGKQGTVKGGLRGRLPFERMKTDKGKLILKGAAKIAGGKAE